jgi:hypothetical protein
VIYLRRWIGKNLVWCGCGLILRYYPSIHLEGLRKTTNNLNHDSWSPGPRFEPRTSRILSRSVNHSRGIYYHGDTSACTHADIIFFYIITNPVKVQSQQETSALTPFTWAHTDLAYSSCCWKQVFIPLEQLLAQRFHSLTFTTCCTCLYLTFGRTSYMFMTWYLHTR